MPKFYRYVLYKLLTFAHKKDNMPISNAIMMITMVHFFYLLTLYTILTLLCTMPEFNLNEGYNKLYFIIFILLFGGLHFWVFYNKKKFQEYIDEFKKESRRKKITGSLLVISYSIGSFLLYIATVILVFGVLRPWLIAHYQYPILK